MTLLCYRYRSQTRVSYTSNLEHIKATHPTGKLMTKTFAGCSKAGYSGFHFASQSLFDALLLAPGTARRRKPSPGATQFIYHLLSPHINRKLSSASTNLVFLRGVIPITITSHKINGALILSPEPQRPSSSDVAKGLVGCLSALASGKIQVEFVLSSRR